MVIFWASWCPPCIHEAPAVERFRALAAGRGRVIGVNVLDGAAEARDFVHQFRWSFPVLRDGDGTTSAAYKIAGLPVTIIFDGHGAIARRLVGPQTTETLTTALQGV